MPREDGFFDDLARGLADGTLTRGKALRLMGAAVVGGALGSLGIGEASADPIGCKRNGKTCTRNDQCCSRNCSGGTCQAQTTTTTTSTSTSTTSTTTTGCLPDGETCTGGGTPCCSGNCSGGTCSACPAGTVELSNGTCARPWVPGAGGCPGTCSCVSDVSFAAYCAGSISLTGCSSNSQCPRGQFCPASTTPGFGRTCIAAC